MGPQSAKAARRPRSDSLRNRELLLEAAAAVFGGGGPDASLDAVARQAGVGIGTLYRHFPTREALFEAVYRHAVDQLGELAERLATEAAPVDALRRWLHANVQLVATKKGRSAALTLAAQASPELRSYSFDRLTKAARALLDRAVAAGEIRKLSDQTQDATQAIGAQVNALRSGIEQVATDYSEVVDAIETMAGGAAEIDDEIGREADTTRLIASSVADAGQASITIEEAVSTIVQSVRSASTFQRASSLDHSAATTRWWKRIFSSIPLSRAVCRTYSRIEGPSVIDFAAVHGLKR